MVSHQCTDNILHSAAKTFPGRVFGRSHPNARDQAIPSNVLTLGAEAGFKKEAS